MKNFNARFVVWFARVTAAVVLCASPLPSLAQCGKTDLTRTHNSAKLAHEGSQAANFQQTSRSRSIVGLWHVTYLAPDGSTVYESFDQWHSDGNEFEVSDLGPGVLCQGTWKVNSMGGVQLFHIGWNYDPMNNNALAGTFTIRQTNKVSEDGNTYHGTFELKNYDLGGNHIPDQDVSGTVTATRLTVQ